MGNAQSSRIMVQLIIRDSFTTSMNPLNSTTIPLTQCCICYDRHTLQSFCFESRCIKEIAGFFGLLFRLMQQRAKTRHFNFRFCFSTAILSDEAVGLRQRQSLGIKQILKGQ